MMRGWLAILAAWHFTVPGYGAGPPTVKEDYILVEMRGTLRDDKGVMLLVVVDKLHIRTPSSEFRLWLDGPFGEAEGPLRKAAKTMSGKKVIVTGRMRIIDIGGMKFSRIEHVIRVRTLNAAN
ncbi:MAG: hypothetical protein K2W96_00065 [Gemmataceae bacterium]|nr:hypothetical protein [Gemmataceae bacterium]